MSLRWFEVCLTADTTMSKFITVQAENKEDAEEIARDRHDAGEGTFEHDEGNYQKIYVSDIQECDPPEPTEERDLKKVVSSLWDSLYFKLGSNDPSESELRGILARLKEELE